MQKRARDAAVARGIQKGEKDAVSIFGRDLPPITDGERFAVSWIATAPAEHLDKEFNVEVPEAVKLQMVERFADYLSSSPLLRKALAAWDAEYRLTENDPPPDGILGRALDDVIGPTRTVPEATMTDTTQELSRQSRRLADCLAEAGKDGDVEYWALTALFGPIRDQLRQSLEQIDVCFEALDKAGFWDEEGGA